MSSALQGKIAVVTGGAVRIGRAIVEALGREGAHVAIHYRRSEQEAQELCAQLEHAGGQAAVFQSDLDSEQSCNALLDEVKERFGRLDILINNAAAFNKGNIAGLSAQGLQDEFWTNLFVPMLLTRTFALSAGKGKVINLLDRRVAGLDADTVAYSLSKKALAEFTQMAALDLAPAISVNGVAPGPVLPPPGEGVEYLRAHAGHIPLECSCSPNDVAEAVLYLLKAEAITGQTIFVDGGQHLLGVDKT